MALKIVYPICCGIDVHKTFVVACIAATYKGVTTYKRHRFSTYTKGLRELSQWLCENDCKDVCVVKRRIRKMPNGLPIYFNMIL
jgi:transposase